MGDEVLLTQNVSVHRTGSIINYLSGIAATERGALALLPGTPLPSWPHTDCA